MPCFIGCIALFIPRVLLFLFLLFNDYVESAFHYWLWPWLGLLFLPLTTLSYAWAIHSSGSVDGWHLIILILAVLIDLGVIGWRPKPPWFRRLLGGHSEYP